MRKINQMMFSLVVILFTTTIGCKTNIKKKGAYKYMIVLDKQKDYTLNRLQNLPEDGGEHYRYDWVQLGPGDTIFVLEESKDSTESEMDFLVKFNGAKGWIDKGLYDVFIKNGTIE